MRMKKKKEFQNTKSAKIQSDSEIENKKNK
jgi:hypothetical protein